MLSVSAQAASHHCGRCTARRESASAAAGWYFHVNWPSLLLEAISWTTASYADTACCTGPYCNLTADGMRCNACHMCAMCLFLACCAVSHMEQSGPEAVVHCPALQTPLLKPLMSVKQETKGAAALPPDCLQQLRSIRSKQVGPLRCLSPQNRMPSILLDQCTSAAHIPEGLVRGCRTNLAPS